MQDDSLNQVLEFNEFLLALEKAQVPLKLSGGNLSNATELRQINDGFLLRSRLGQSLSQALEEDEQLPPLYRWAVQAGLESGKWARSLETLSRPAQIGTQLRASLGISLVQPLVILTLAYLGFLLLCTLLAPRVGALYDQMRQEPGTVASLLLVASESIPLWSVALPVVLLVLILWWKISPESWTRLLPGRAKYQRNVRQAAIADLAATLVESGVSQETAARVASLTGRDSVQSNLPEHLSTTDSDDATMGALHQQLPPLVASALAIPYSPEKTSQLLRVAADTYRSKAQSQATYWHEALPTLLAALLGGVIVLIYGLSVFGTMSQLLQDIAG